MYEINLTQTELDRLQSPVSPSAGGFQALLDDLQAKMAGKKVVIVSETLADRIVDYVKKYGRGGYQNRLRPIAKAIQRQRGQS